MLEERNSTPILLCPVSNATGKGRKAIPKRAQCFGASKRLDGRNGGPGAIGMPGKSAWNVRGMSRKIGCLSPSFGREPRREVVTLNSNLLGRGGRSCGPSLEPSTSPGHTSRYLLFKERAVQRLNRNIKNIAGQRFGRLSVLEFAGTRSYYGRVLALWKVRCDCGVETEVFGYDLRTGRVKSCGCAAGAHLCLDDLTGRKIGSLSVLRLARQPRRSDKRGGVRRAWECVCECGRQVTRGTRDLLTQKHPRCRRMCDAIPRTRGRLTFVRTIRSEGRKRIARWMCSCGRGVESPMDSKRKSCGCVREERQKRYRLNTREDAARRLMREYQKAAKRRKLEWNLSFAEFLLIVTAPCHYTGRPPQKIVNTQEGEFLWNGIDRKDSSIGYVPGNCVPCCQMANWCKNKFSYQDFLAFVRQVSLHLKLTQPLRQPSLFPVAA